MKPSPSSIAAVKLRLSGLPVIGLLFSNDFVAGDAALMLGETSTRTHRPDVFALLRGCFAGDSFDRCTDGEAMMILVDAGRRRKAAERGGMVGMSCQHWPAISGIVQYDPSSCVLYYTNGRRMLPVFPSCC